MLCEFRHPRCLILALVVPVIVLLPLGGLRAEASASRTDSPGILYLLDSDANAPAFTPVAEDLTCSEPNLVVVTHGWYERRDWPSRMSAAIARRVDRRQWQCGWFDWRTEAKHLRPSQSATIGRDITGPLLGKRIVGLSENWQHVHLIGHSAGAWVVSTAAGIVASKTNAEIHITLLDAYVPDGWNEKALGRLVQRHPDRCWADHYFTRDLLNLTENVLTGAHNVDITAINPGIRGHLFPWHWYLATITGRYTTDDRFASVPVFCQGDGTTYGFARTLEASPLAWRESTMLKPANSPIHIRGGGEAPR